MPSRKLSLVIDESADAVISPYLTPGTPQREAVARPDAKEAEILRALLVRGARAIEREQLAAGYAALAAELGDKDLEFAADSHAGMLRVLAAEADSEAVADAA